MSNSSVSFATNELSDLSRDGQRQFTQVEAFPTETQMADPIPEERRATEGPSTDILLKVSQTVFKRISSTSLLRKLFGKEGGHQDTIKSHKKETRTGIASAHIEDSNKPKSDGLAGNRFSMSKPNCHSSRSISVKSEGQSEDKPSLTLPLDCKDESKCLVCCEAPCNAVFLPCGHGGLCTPCAILIFEQRDCKCTMCRQSISKVITYEQGVGKGLIQAASEFNC